MGRKLTREEFIDKVKANNMHFANGEIDILGEYVNIRSHIACKCNVCNHVWSPSGGSLILGRGCPKCGRKTTGRKKQLSHDQFVERVNSLNRGFIVVGTYVKSGIKVKMQCSLGHEWDAFPEHLFNGVGCPYCAGYKVWPGFNDLWTTHPNIAKLLKNKDDGFKYSKASYKQAVFVCPDCGHEAIKHISDVYADGFSCPMCSDGISYPNKFGRLFLKQLPINNLICEYHPVWATPYIYDNYFQYDGVDYILEMDGGFHYLESNLSNISLAERKETDTKKDELAINNNIKIIRINCLKSDKDYIANNILHSELKDIFDLSMIDWDLCDQKAQKSLVKESCDLYVSGIHKISTIANMLNIGESTVRRYLKKGNIFGWC